MGLAEAVQGAMGQPSSIRIGTVTSVSPVQISAQGVPFEDVGVLFPFVPRVDMTVVLIGQSSQAGTDPASWLCLGPVVGLGALPIPKTLTEGTDINLGATVYVAATPICGVDFIAPPSGIVRVDWAARFDTATINNRVLVSMALAEGATLDAGTVISGATDASALENHQEPAAAGAATRMEAGIWRYVDGLTPGATYNAVVKMRNTVAATSTVFDRSILVTPM